MIDQKTLAALSEDIRSQLKNASKVCEQMTKAQAQMAALKLNATNSEFGKAFANMGAVRDAVLKPLTDNDLCIMQFAQPVGNAFAVSTAIAHKSGQSVVSTIALPMAPRATAHDLGKLETYLRRYSAVATLFLAQEDDDGNSASLAPRADDSLLTWVTIQLYAAADSIDRWKELNREVRDNRKAFSENRLMEVRAARARAYQRLRAAEATEKTTEAAELSPGEAGVLQETSPEELAPDNEGATPEQCVTPLRC